MNHDYLITARKESEQRLERFREALQLEEGRLGEKGCVYATGSFGRLEAGPESDLDLFIVIHKNNKGSSKSEEPRFCMDDVQQIKMKNQIIVSAEDAGFPRFDGGGKFLKTHSFESYADDIGSQRDDFENTLTGRMLLLLESKPLMSENCYNALIDSVLKKYFRDYGGKEDCFIPSFLFNDIMRMWRTFCVNYEFFKKENNWHSKNLKLKFSRLLTCYSAIIWILNNYTLHGSVTPDAAKEMISLTPLERVQSLEISPSIEVEFNGQSGRQYLSTLLDEYADFLKLMHDPRTGDKLEPDVYEVWRGRSHNFGSKLASLATIVAGPSPLENALYRVVLA